MKSLPLLLLLLLVALGRVTSALKVLGIFPNPALSHQMVYQELMKAMVVTVLTSSPLKVPHSAILVTSISSTELLLLVALGRVTSALKVLGSFPNPALSHQMVYQELMKAMVVTVLTSSPLKVPHSAILVTSISSTELLLLVALGRVTSALKVLGSFPNPALSHQMVYQELMKAMVVTVLTSSPLKEPLQKYTDVDTSTTLDLEDFQEMTVPTEREKQDAGGLIRAVEEMGLQLCHGVFTSSQVQQTLIRSGESGFDLAVVELLMTPCVNGLVHHVGSPPMAAILSFMALPTAHRSLGAYFNPAHMPQMFSPTLTDSMTFWEGLGNSLVWVGLVAMYDLLLIRSNDDFQRRIFGEAPPPLAESDTNYSLLLQHHHWSLGYPQPLTPNMVQVRGMHLKDHSQPLPQDVEAFMAGARDDGVVYCSFGSLFNTDDLTEDQVELMMAAFEAIPQRVLWKWDSRPLPRNISNVFTSKWFPQQDILADPRVRLFVTQGGVQSLQEAVSRQVPLLGVPFMPDQKYNVHAMKVRGVALSLSLRETTAEKMAAAIQELILDPGYREAMARLARVYGDREGSRSSVDSAVFWLEYAVRHRGAPHLRSAALELHWTQALLLDVGVFVALGLVVQGLRHRPRLTLCLLLLLLWGCFCCC